jgi:hypothetical protein
MREEGVGDHGRLMCATDEEGDHTPQADLGGLVSMSLGIGRRSLMALCTAFFPWSHRRNP